MAKTTKQEGSDPKESKGDPGKGKAPEAISPQPMLAPFMAARNAARDQAKKKKGSDPV